jgi:hypothetical protein
VSRGRFPRSANLRAGAGDSQPERRPHRRCPPREPRHTNPGSRLTSRQPARAQGPATAARHGCVRPVLCHLAPPRRRMVPLAADYPLPRAVVEELATHMGPLGAADAHVFTSDKGGILRTSNFRAKVWLPAIRAVLDWRRCARTTSATLPLHCRSPLARTPRKSACAPGTRRSASRSTATATCSPRCRAARAPGRHAR